MAIYFGTHRADVFTGADEAQNEYRFRSSELTASDMIFGSASPDTVDRLVITSFGFLGADRFAGLSGIEHLSLRNGGVVWVDHTFAASARGKRLEIFGSSATEMVVTTAVTDAEIRIDLGAGGDDRLFGGVAGETALMALAALTADDVLSFGGGDDTLELRGGGVLAADALAQVTGLDRLRLVDGGTAVLDDGVFGARFGGLQGSAADDGIDAAGVTETGFAVRPGAGIDTIFTGSRADHFEFRTGDLGAGDRFDGGAGDDIADFIEGGPISAAETAGISGIETYRLGAPGALSVSDANLAGLAVPRLTLDGSAGDDLLDGAAVTAPGAALVLIGNGGADTALGGAGDDVIALADAGFARADGGTGLDRMSLGGAGQRLDLVKGLGDVAGIEIVDLSGADGAELIVDPDTVRAVTDAGALWMVGGADDSVRAGTGWTLRADDAVLAEEPGAVFRHYTAGTAELYLQDSLGTIETAEVVTGMPTGIAGTADAMISLRMQEHMVQTADGGYHLMANLGDLGGLTLVSSYDAGTSWQAAFALAETGNLSTADLSLDRSTGALSVVYADADDAIQHAAYSYAGGTWNPVSSATVAAAPLQPLQGPTVATGPDGDLWVAASANLFTDAFEIVLYRSADQGQTWAEVDVALEDAASRTGVARLLATDDDLVLVYSTGDALYAASSADGASWSSEKLLYFPAFQIDPFRSHFSAAVAGDDIHLFTSEGARDLAYFTRDGETGPWSEKRMLTTDAGGAYMQASVSDDGGLYVTYDNRVRDRIEVLESLDGGASFETAGELAYLPFDEVGYPRMETAGAFDGDLLTLQQIEPVEDQHALVSYLLEL